MVQVLTNSAVLCLISLSSTIVFPVISGLNPREGDANFPEFSKRAEGSPSRASCRSKTFPDVPVTCGIPESRQGVVLGVGIVEG